MAWKSALPGSPVVMCHQSTVTGPAAADGDSAGAAVGAAVAAVVGATDGAVVAVEPPQAAARIETAATAPANRTRVDTMGPPPRLRTYARGPCARKFRSTCRQVSGRTLVAQLRPRQPQVATSCEVPSHARKFRAYTRSMAATKARRRSPDRHTIAELAQIAGVCMHTVCNGHHERHGVD